MILQHLAKASAKIKKAASRIERIQWICILLCVLSVAFLSQLYIQGRYSPNNEAKINGTAGDFFTNGSDDTNYLLSKEGLYNVSEDKNVIVFILDTFDKELFDSIYADDQKCADFLDGFTYFSNMVSGYTFTAEAIPYILTGQYYENLEQPYSEYIEEAWEKSADYYEALKNEGFDIGIYTTVETAVSSGAKNKWIKNTAIDEDVELFSWSNAEFYRDLTSEKLSLVKNKQYAFIHLKGTHTPYTLLEDLSEAGDGQATAITEAKGCLFLLREYISQLKDLGVYDQTCIIVTGDNGYHAKPKSNPIMLMKGFQDRGEIQCSDIPVSQANIMPAIMEQLGLNDGDKFGYFMRGQAELFQNNRRYFQNVLLKTEKGVFTHDMIEYSVLPDGNSEDNYIPTGRIYTQDGIAESKPYQYQIGTQIIFENGKAHSYFISGVEPIIEKNSFGYYSWTYGHSGKACFDVGEIEQGLFGHIYLTCWSGLGPQRVKISSNGRLLYDRVISSNVMPYANFYVPRECIQEGILILDFEYPDACSARERGTGADANTLSVQLHQILFMEPEQTDTILFTENGNANDFVYDGWNDIGENGACWTNEMASLIAILLGENSEQMEITYTSNPAAGDTSVYYNGEYVGTLPYHNDYATERILLPSQYRSETDAQVITFTTDGATTYDGLEYEDTRILGIHVSEIHFADVE